MDQYGSNSQNICVWTPGEQVPGATAAFLLVLVRDLVSK